ncbi:hypothetical protein IW967_00375 [Alicyclobacillus mali]|uniref:Uncharacterized protein n=1 Tax=Alicyclobacillus mali (ex Roth et al. 2021) TaxID=1123961 RepID=A0ABS0EZ79_9BACL|nr:hypothetical protein [Alicyclobacillus mali (ex Roth et al. 2021)]MBF8376348.1 hypothetical protein [Alicyclobacillus mali (ex Roth et al. 2021)]
MELFIDYGVDQAEHSVLFLDKSKRWIVTFSNGPMSVQIALSEAELRQIARDLFKARRQPSRSFLER